MTQLRTAFVLAGGGSLGAVEVGMLRALAERGLTPDMVVGSSVGAINGAYYSARPDVTGAEGLATVWRGLRRSDIFPFQPFGGFFGFVGLRSHLLDANRLRVLLEQHLPIARLEDAKVPCHVVATDVLSGEEVCLYSGPLVEALLASAAIPAVFPPVPIRERRLVDGAVASNTPLATAVALGAQRVIVLPTGFSCAIERPPTSALGMALHAVNLLIARQLVVDVDRFCSLAEIIVVPPLCPLSVSSADFSRTEELIHRATDSTRHWLDGGGLLSREVPRNLRPHKHPRLETAGDRGFSTIPTPTAGG